MAFQGRPLSNDTSDEELTGALLMASQIDETRRLRLRFEEFLRALSKKK